MPRAIRYKRVLYKTETNKTAKNKPNFFFIKSLRHIYRKSAFLYYTNFYSTFSRKEEDEGKKKETRKLMTTSGHRHRHCVYS